MKDARLLCSFWRFAIMISTDGAGTLWFVIRLKDGKEIQQ